MIAFLISTKLFAATSYDQVFNSNSGRLDYVTSSYGLLGIAGNTYIKTDGTSTTTASIPFAQGIMIGTTSFTSGYLEKIVMTATDTRGIYIDGATTNYTGSVSRYGTYIDIDSDSATGGGTDYGEFVQLNLRSLANTSRSGYGLNFNVTAANGGTTSSSFGDVAGVLGSMSRSGTYVSTSSSSAITLPITGLKATVQTVAMTVGNSSTGTVTVNNIGVSGAVTAGLLTVSAGTVVIKNYGGFFTGRGALESVSTSYGIYAKASNGDTNYSIYADAPSGGSVNYAIFGLGDFGLTNSGDSTKLFKITVDNTGDSTITSSGGDISFSTLNLLTTGTLGSGNTTVTGTLVVTSTTTLATSLTGLLKATAGVVSVDSTAYITLASLSGTSPITYNSGTGAIGLDQTVTYSWSNTHTHTATNETQYRASTQSIWSSGTGVLDLKASTTANIFSTVTTINLGNTAVTTANLATGATTTNVGAVGDIQVGSSGKKLGFFGSAGAVQSSAYTPTNVSTDRSYDANSTSVDELADVLGTLIADLQTHNLLH